MAKDVVVVACAALDIFEAFTVKACLRSRTAVTATAAWTKPTIVAGTGGIRTRGLAGTMARAYLPRRVRRAAHIAGGAEKERVPRSVLVALTEAIVVAKTV